jgi:glutamyl-tRNA reductase
MLPALVNESDIIIVSTHANEATVSSTQIRDLKPRVFLDLSIPSNVDCTIRNIPLQKVVDVDDISIILSNTLDIRRQEVPKAKAILQEVQNEFISWLGSYSHAPLVKAMKEKLSALSQTSMGCELAGSFSYDQLMENNAYSIKKTISRLAINLRTKNEKGCQLIEAYNHFLNSPHSV